MSSSLNWFVYSGLALSLLTACGGGGGSDDPPAVSNPVRPSNSTCLAPELSAPSGDELSLVAAFPGLPAISRLVGLYQAPQDDTQWYALSQQGRILQFDNDPDASNFRVFLDQQSTTDSSSNESGMLGFAFHPNYQQNGMVYVYTMPSTRTSQLLRYSLNRDSGVLDPDSAQLLLEIAQPAANHNGGDLGFGPDGYLYLSLGDGGSAGDPFGNGQDPFSLLGSMLRLDINVSSDSTAYGIPPDNPFADGRGGRPEIYAYGLRNPWRWSFDRSTGDLWLGDVGQYDIEEIDRITLGGNYGWNIMEGDSCYGANSCQRQGLTPPVVDYSHRDTGGCSVTGGYVYRGSAMPSLFGQYLFGDFCNGDIYSIDSDAPDDMTQLLDSGLSLSAFAQDASGELYALNLQGAAGAGIFRLVANNSTGDSAIPERLSQTGCLSDTANRTMATGVVPYAVNSPLWSDGADKERFFAIPDGTQITLNDAGEFQFPDRSVLIKHFYYLEDILETRLFMKHSSGWAGYSYQWNPQRSDAVLLDSGAILAVDNNYQHIFPSRGDCMRCHTSAAGWSLGPETLQLNTADGDTLGQLRERGYLAQAVPNSLLESQLYGLEDGAASMAQRARSYLHSNCASCHRPGGPISGIDFRFSTPLSQTGICDVAPLYGNYGLSNARLLVPGDASRSIVALRMGDTGSNRMPPLASQVVDEVGHDLIKQWIASLSQCE